MLHQVEPSSWQTVVSLNRNIIFLRFRKRVTRLVLDSLRNESDENGDDGERRWKKEESCKRKRCILVIALLLLLLKYRTNDIHFNEFPSLPVRYAKYKSKEIHETRDRIIIDRFRGISRSTASTTCKDRILPSPSRSKELYYSLGRWTFDDSVWSRRVGEAKEREKVSPACLGASVTLDFSP